MPTLPPRTSSYGVSADGAVVVGRSLTNPSSASDRAFRWTTKKQIQDLRQELLNLGVGAVGDWILLGATGVSADGALIVGEGLNPSRQREAFRVTLPVPL